MARIGTQNMMAIEVNIEGKNKKRYSETRDSNKIVIKECFDAIMRGLHISQHNTT